MSTSTTDAAATVEAATNGNTGVAKPFDWERLTLAVWERRAFAVRVTAAALCLSVCVAMLKKDRYTAAVLLMPPDSQTLSTTSSLAALSGSQIVGGIAGGGGLLNARTPGATVIGILGSRTLMNQIVDRFHLTAAFHTRYRQDARGRLLGMTEISEDKKSGLVSISVTDKDPRRARDIANAYVDGLDAALNLVSTSSAHQERVFLEGRLKTLKSEMDVMAEQLSRFSSKTATLNPQAQGQALFESLGKLESELSAAQAELSGLRTTYSDANIRVRAAKARVDSLSGQVAMLTGSANTGGDAAHSTQPFPTIRQLPLVGVTYTAMSQQLAAEQSVYAVLTRQYELARVEEAKQLPSAKVLDSATLPEKPSSISRLLIVLLGTLLGAVVAVVALAVQFFFQGTPVAGSSLPSNSNAATFLRLRAR